MSINDVAELSHYYGANPEYVIAGGGNTSYKEDGVLYIKGSGTSMAAIKPEEFVRMDRAALARIWEKSYPDDDEAREAAVLADMMAARFPGETRRPSVETQLHDLLQFTYIVHTHPSLVNGLCCSKNAEAAAKKLFPDAIWLGQVRPGYTLSKLVRDAEEAYRKDHGKYADVILLQNHGIFVGADTPGGIKAVYERVLGTIKKEIKREPDFSGGVFSAADFNNNDFVREIAQSFTECAAEAGFTCFSFAANAEMKRMLKDRESFYPLSRAFTPDHIVYAGSDPLFVKKDSVGGEKFKSAWKAHVAKTGFAPKIAAVQDMGAFGLGTSQKNADTAMELFLDAVKVAVYAESFGGPSFLSEELTDFINNWEVERYRKSVSG